MILTEIHQLIVDCLREWPILAPVLYIVIRIVVTVVPFIPGIAVNTAGILLFGWFVTFIYVTVGTVIGGVIIFFSMRYFQKPLARRFVSIKRLDQYTNLLSGPEQFWSLVLLRIPAALTFDYLSYAAGISGISFRNFFTSLFIVELAINFPVIAFSDMAFRYGYFAFFAIIGALIAAYLFLRRVNWNHLAKQINTR